jgi:hypothetical protein
MKVYKIELFLDVKPVRLKLYWINQNFVEMVKEELDKLLKGRFTWLMENIEWMSPKTLVPKKNLNGATKKDRFLIHFVMRLLKNLPDVNCIILKMDK